eukprot:scaffold687_cov119-Isochrysis_galbana.AAC.7
MRVLVGTHQAKSTSLELVGSVGSDGGEPGCEWANPKSETVNGRPPGYMTLSSVIRPSRDHDPSKRSIPTSSCVSRAAVTSSSPLSASSARPPGSATCPDHGSVGFVALLMKRTSSSPLGPRRKTAASAARRPFVKVGLRRHWPGNAASAAAMRMELAIFMLVLVIEI